MNAPSAPIATLYVGTHRRAHRADSADTAFGIYVFRMEDGSDPHLVGLSETAYPGWIATHPSRRFLYAVNETRSLDGVEGGGVSAFAIDPASGALTALNTVRLPPMPCHCAVEASGRFLLVATFGGGSVHMLPIAADGRLGAESDSHHHAGTSIHPQRQTGPHAHAVAIDPESRFVIVPDLGIDQLLVYRIDAEAGRLVPQPERTVALAPGSGPRHIAFSRDGRFAYLMNEMSATILVFAYDTATGALDPRQSVDLQPAGFIGLRSGAAIEVHPAGGFLYATTRSHGSSGMPDAPGLDRLLWFPIDAADGTFGPGGAVPSGGGIPRSIAFSPDGDRLYVGHQCSGTVVAFDLDPTSGAPVQRPRVLETPVPVCLTFLP